MPQVPSILVLSDLAKTEHDATGQIPPKAGTRPARIEPLRTAVIPPDAQDARAAAGSGNPFHRDPEDFAVGLILVLISDVRAGFGGKQFDDVTVEALSVLLAPFPQAGRIEQFGGGGHPGVAEVGRGEDDRVDRLFLVERRERRFLHEVLGVGADFEAGLHALEECLFGNAADEEGAPLRELGLDHEGRRLRRLPLDDGLKSDHHVFEVGVGAGLHPTEQVVLTDGKLTQLTVGDKSFHNSLVVTVLCRSSSPGFGFATAEKGLIKPLYAVANSQSFQGTNPYQDITIYG